MREDRIESEQSIDCTDEPTEAFSRFAPEKKSRPTRPGSFHRSTHPSGLSDRALPPLRETGLQVRRWAGTWSQVLPLRQLSRSETTAAVCPGAVPRTGQPIPGQLSEAEEPPREHLRHQPRTAAKENGAVGDGCLAHQNHLGRCRGHRNRTRPDAALSSSRGQGLRDRSRGGHR